MEKCSSNSEEAKGVSGRSAREEAGVRSREKSQTEEGGGPLRKWGLCWGGKPIDENQEGTKY